MADTESGFSADERAAMKQRAEELRTTKGLKGAAKLAKEFEAIDAAIDALEDTDKAVATALHRIVLEVAPQLEPKTWYGFPSYAQGGNVVVFYQPASKFDTRYTSIGFNEDAALDDGPFWATAFAVLEWTDEVEKALRPLVRKAAATPDAD